MAEMLPQCPDSEVDMMIAGPGAVGERLLYRSLRDHLPGDWCVIWNRRIANNNANHQYDFIILVPGQGVLILDAKGHGYQYNDQGILGCRHYNPATQTDEFTPDPDLFNNVQHAKMVLINDLRNRFGQFGACNCLVRRR